MTLAIDILEWASIEDLIPARLREFNQNHDAQGRFSSGSDSAAVEHQVITDARAGGGTINPVMGTEATHGYAVAIPNHSSISPSAVFFAKDSQTGEPHGVAIVDQWLKDNATVFDSNPGIHIGVWNDTVHNEIVLDPSEVILDRDTALQAGIDRDQQAIYHLDTGETIDTGGTGGR
jgi:hypothetical protein